MTGSSPRPGQRARDLAGGPERWSPASWSWSGSAPWARGSGI